MFLSLHQRKIINIKSDGNCFFRAISYLLFNNEDEHWPLRNLIIRFENLNLDIFKERLTAINKGTIEEHLMYLSRPNTWATHVEVFAVATYFQAAIYFCIDPPSQKWECHMPVTSSEKLRYPILEPPFDDNISVSHFELVYHTQGHYSSVIDANTGILCRSPPPVIENHSYENKVLQ